MKELGQHDGVTVALIKQALKQEGVSTADEAQLNLWIQISLNLWIGHKKRTDLLLNPSVRTHNDLIEQCEQQLGANIFGIIALLDA